MHWVNSSPRSYRIQTHSKLPNYDRQTIQFIQIGSTEFYSIDWTTIFVFMGGSNGKVKLFSTRLNEAEMGAKDASNIAKQIQKIISKL